MGEDIEQAGAGEQSRKRRRSGGAGARKRVRVGGLGEVVWLVVVRARATAAATRRCILDVNVTLIYLPLRNVCKCVANRVGLVLDAFSRQVACPLCVSRAHIARAL